MYFMMTCLSPDDGYLATLDYDFTEDEDLLRDWMAGERFYILPPQPVCLTREPRSDTVMAEMWQVPVPVMHSRLYEVLVQAGVTNIDTYPAEIYDPETGFTDRGYLAFNIVGRIAATDAMTTHADVLISAPRLSEEKIGDALMFRLDEAVNVIVVHDSVKAEIEAAGIDTLTFRESQDWIA